MTRSEVILSIDMRGNDETIFADASRGSRALAARILLHVRAERVARTAHP